VRTSYRPTEGLSYGVIADPLTDILIVITTVDVENKILRV